MEIHKIFIYWMFLCKTNTRNDQSFIISQIIVSMHTSSCGPNEIIQQKPISMVQLLLPAGALFESIFYRESE